MLSTDYAQGTYIIISGKGKNPENAFKTFYLYNVCVLKGRIDVQVSSRTTQKVFLDGCMCNIPSCLS